MLGNPISVHAFKVSVCVSVDLQSPSCPIARWDANVWWLERGSYLMHRGTILLLFRARPPSRPPGLGWTSCCLDDRHVLDFTGLEPLRHLWFKLRKWGRGVGGDLLSFISQSTKTELHTKPAHTLKPHLHMIKQMTDCTGLGGKRERGDKESNGWWFSKEALHLNDIKSVCRVCDKEGSETKKWFWLESCLWFWVHGCVRLEAAAIIDSNVKGKSRKSAEKGTREREIVHKCVETKRILWGAM